MVLLVSSPPCSLALPLTVCYHSEGHSFCDVATPQTCRSLPGLPPLAHCCHLLRSPLAPLLPLLHASDHHSTNRGSSSRPSHGIDLFWLRLRRCNCCHRGEFHRGVNMGVPYRIPLRDTKIDSRLSCDSVDHVFQVRILQGNLEVGRHTEPRFLE